MPAGVIISVGEYLETTYRPDRDYVDGELLERNTGEQDHAWLQLEIGFWLRSRAKELRIKPLPECRLQVKATRFRVPDILVLRDDAPRDPIVREAPLLCVEILSSDDTLKAILRRVQDYLDMGVPTCWILDPIDRLAWIADVDGVHAVKDGVLRASHITLPLTDIWPS